MSARRAWGLGLAAVAIGLLVVAGGGALLLRPRPNPPPVAVNYRNPQAWLCRPGRADACAADLTATSIAADGTATRVAPPNTADPPIDCFYVYPTVSRDRHENAPLALSAAEDEVARVQFARFRSVCRTYAPLYRQLTLRAIFARAIGFGGAGDFDLALGDVRAAFQDYLAHDNHGRGVVLIGHSQGSRMLKALLRTEFDGTPAQSRLVMAVLAGNGVVVPEGAAVGGDFKHIPICGAAGQFGCVIAYSTFRASSPPPLDGPSGAAGHYGIDPGGSMRLACANPAALAGGRAPLEAALPERLERAGQPWADPPVAVQTPFVMLPGLILGECVHGNGRSYLAISFESHPGDRRRGDINGDVKILGRVQKGWGLHLLDVNLVQGDLVRAVQAASAAYLSRHATP
jgi:hypothetical protein